MIFNIQRFSTHDGDGIRTIIFFKGCPLRCRWCSNPESQAFGYDLLFDPRRCIACRECARLSQQGEFTADGGSIVIHRENIVKPFIFEGICPAKAITVAGDDKSIAEILAEIEKDQPFYANSGGGVTLSGGEPFAQPEMLHELLLQLKRINVPVAVETCLHVAWQSIEPNVALIDVFLADLKHTDSHKFHEQTNGDLHLILANLRQLERLGAPVVIRIPVIPGFNHTETEMRRILDMAAALTNVHEVHFIPYHALGANKYALLGKNYELTGSSVSEDELAPYIAYASEKWLAAIVGG